MFKNEQGKCNGTAEVLFKYERSKIDAISRGAHLGRGVKAKSYGVTSVEDSNTIIQNLIGTVAELQPKSRAGNRKARIHEEKKEVSEG